jgi:hypothetical protein
MTETASVTPGSATRHDVYEGVTSFVLALHTVRSKSIQIIRARWETLRPTRSSLTRWRLP